MNRRYFFFGVLGAAAAARTIVAADQKVRLGIIGCGGRGEGNWRELLDQPVQLLCDVDLSRTAEAAKAFPSARLVQDFRRVIERNDIDAVVISTPDHWHAIPAVWAMETGKHVYCEKPLARTVAESMAMRRAAAEKKVATQLGTQIHAGRNYRRVVELVRAGIIGKIDRVEVWCEREPPASPATVGAVPPSTLDYDLWVGPSEYTDYDPSVTPFGWRWHWNYGGGVLADMGCHFMDLPHWALELGHPRTVKAEGVPGSTGVPKRLKVDYRYETAGSPSGVHLTWYHGLPGPWDASGQARDYGMRNGVLFHGERGQLVADYSNHRLLPEAGFRDLKKPEQSIPDSPGHQQEWIRAIQNGGRASCDFAYGGVLTETVLLGNVAYRSGRELTWNPEKMTTGSADADRYLRAAYRSPWKLHRS